MWIGLARASKLIVSFRVGKRDQENADAFMMNLRSWLITIPVLSTDAFPGYRHAVGEAFDAVDYGQVVKSFTGRKRDYDNVAPKKGPPAMAKRPICGAPMAECSTSLAEREMLNLRTHLRRLVRRGTGHSKTLHGHIAQIACYVFCRNFCRIHTALKNDACDGVAYRRLRMDGDGVR